MKSIRKNIRLIGIDLDGTLLTTEKIFTGRSKDALTRALNAGVTVMIATGRPLRGIPPEITSLPGMKYALTANGARIVDITTGDTIEHSLIPHGVGEQLLHIIEPYDAMKEIYFDGYGYIENEGYENAHLFLSPPMVKYVHSTRDPIDSLQTVMEEHPGGLDKVHFIFRDESERLQAYKQIINFSDSIEITNSLGNNIEINQKGVAKGSSLVRFGHTLGISREEIMAVGDGLNDLNMIQEAGLGVAMENADPLCRDAADYITDTNDRDGVAKAIEKFVLN